MKRKKTPQLNMLLDRVTDLTSGLGQKAALARAIGVTPQQLNDWFSGRCKPNGEMSLRLLSWIIGQELEESGHLNGALELLMPPAKPGKKKSKR